MRASSARCSVNEFFECAKRRGQDGRDPAPYYLYIDEFQNFVSLDIARMLDEVRKFGLFLVLAHQRFGQLDEELIDGVLTNCRIKSVFGGLPVGAARLMAEELFIGDLDPKKIKAAIYQTKFWPQYSRDKAYGKSSTSASMTGGSEAFGSASFDGTAAGESFFTGSDLVWLSPASRHYRIDQFRLDQQPCPGFEFGRHLRHQRVGN